MARGENIAEQSNQDVLINCLRNEKVRVSFIAKQSSFIVNPKHALYGGMAENSVRTLTVPMLPSGSLKQILTKDEELFLEEYLALPVGELSINKRVDNYWKNYYIRLTKQDIILDLNDAEDYIKYKVLLANDNIVAPNREATESRNKESYQFILLSDSKEIEHANEFMNIGTEAAIKFGEIRADRDTVRFVLQTIEGKPLSVDTKIEFLQAALYKAMIANTKLFLSICKDKMFNTKMFITKCVESKVISKRGDYYYATKGNTPLCESNENPTLDTAAIFLNKPINQTIKATLEATLKSLQE